MEFQLYEYVALWLVKFEQPRTQTDFEQSYTFKMFCFQFINFYLPLIYIAVIKVGLSNLHHYWFSVFHFQGRFFAHPGELGQHIVAKGEESYFSVSKFIKNQILENTGCSYVMSNLLLQIVQI